MADKEKLSITTSISKQSKLSTSLQTSELVTNVLSASNLTAAVTTIETSGTTTALTSIDSSPSLTMLQKINTLIHTLQSSFSNHHPRIIQIYALIKDLNSPSTKVEWIHKRNEALGEELPRCVSEIEVDILGARMTQLVWEKEEVD